MSGWTLFWILVVLFVVIEPVVIVWAVIRMVWNKLAEAHPGRPASGDAITRRFQSFRLGIVNLGFAVHATADEGHLHLELIKPLRWLGARRASIPWDAITVVSAHASRWMTVRIGRYKLLGPRWCLELAEPAVPTE